MMTYLDFDRFKATPLLKDPYDHIVVPNFIRAEKLTEALTAFPEINEPGSFPLDKLKYGPAFERVVEEFRSPENARLFSEKFGVDITKKPLMVTVRGQTQEKDGRIHVDTDSKIITCLIYMNDGWTAEGGRLRILRDGENLENMTAEVAPLAGTLLAFRRSEVSWHGHKPYVGQRRTIQLNWVTDQGAVDHHIMRHKISAMLKSIKRFFSK
jgi:SM-20-related protein